MYHHRIADWDDAYVNGAHVAGGERWPDAWATSAKAWREARAAAGKARLDVSYGPTERNRYDLFLPDGEPRGLVVFIHGGYWMKFDQTYWSHLANGPVDRGFAVAMPTYTLCPQNSITGIVAEIAAAAGAVAGAVSGPIHIAGHSAGGHLATRMVCTDTALDPAVRERIGNVVSISGLHDLRPLLRTAMNDTLHIDQAEAMAQSPLFHDPLAHVKVTCWVGGSERAEFIRHSKLLANAWIGVGGATAFVEEPNRHHFNVVDGLVLADHPLTRVLLAD